MWYYTTDDVCVFIHLRKMLRCKNADSLDVAVLPAPGEERPDVHASPNYTLCMCGEVCHCSASKNFINDSRTISPGNWSQFARTFVSRPENAFSPNVSPSSLIISA